MHPVADAAVETLFLGPSLDAGPKPAIFYFAISAKDSLSLDPFCQPIEAIDSTNVRIFSMTLPFHGPTDDPYQAISKWAANIDTLTQFLDDAETTINHLMHTHIIDPNALGMMGLSRGGLISAHLAARIPHVKSLVGFAPVTRISVLSEFASGFADAYEPKHLIDHLYNRKVRYYMGNHDMRVSTRACFEWIEALIDRATHAQIASPPIELILTPSIGRYGHGTPKASFIEGGRWLLDQL